MDLRELTTLYDFTGKTVVITGGTGVLGGEMACALAGCKANVAILGRNQQAAEQILRRIETMEGVNGRATFVPADVLKRETLLQAEARIREAFGSIDALVNVAGGNRTEATTRDDLRFFDLPEDALRFVFDLNIVGTMLPSQVFGRGMAQNKHGVIVNISSMAAHRPLTRVVAYSAAKAAINNFTQWLAVHMAQDYSPNIRVNALAPGFFLTSQNRFLLTDEATGEMTPRGQTILDHTPMGRFGKPGDLAGALLWLLSPASAFVTGIVVPVDGGFSAFSGV